MFKSYSFKIHLTSVINLIYIYKEKNALNLPEVVAPIVPMNINSLCKHPDDSTVNILSTGVSSGSVIDSCVYCTPLYAAGMADLQI